MKVIYLVISTLVYLLTIGVPSIFEQSLKIDILNIGQGDATLVKTPSNKYILIDTGPDNFVMEEIGKSLPFYVRDIDLLIVSHPHYDHLGAIKEIISYYNVKKIIWFEVDYKNPIYEYLKYIRNTHSITFEEPTDNLVIDIDGVKLYFLFPKKIESRNYQNINNASVVFLLKFEKFTAIFSGDAELEEEADLIRPIQSLMSELRIKSVTYMKAPHHCSKTSSSEDFLLLLKPKLATCSVGLNNKFGHPSQEVLKRFEKIGIKYFRTDKDGDVIMTYYQGTFTVKAEKHK